MGHYSQQYSMYPTSDEDDATRAPLIEHYEASLVLYDENENDPRKASEQIDEDVTQCCKGCLFLCQADCCLLWQKYREWKTPAAVEGVMFLLYFAQGLLIPATWQYVYEYVAEYALPGQVKTTYVSDLPTYQCKLEEGIANHTSDHTFDLLKKEKIFNYTKDWVGIVLTASTLPTVFTSLTLVSFTDIIGRKFGFILPTIGSIVGITWSLIIDSRNIPLLYLVIPNLFMGACGGITTITGSAYTYISETVPENSRTFRFSLLSMIRTVSFSIAVLFSDYIIKAIGYRGICLVALTFYIVCLLYEAFVLPESYKLAKGFVGFSCTALCVSPMLPVSVYSQPREYPKSRLILSLLLAITFIEAYIFYSSNRVMSQYLIKPPFCLNTTQETLLSVFYIILLISGPFMARVVMSRYITDPGLSILACLTSGLGLILQGLAQGEFLLYVSILLQIFLPLPSALCSSIASKLIRVEEQGSLQASFSCARALAEVLCMYLTDKIYEATFDLLHGFVFILIGLFSFIAMGLFIIVWRIQRQFKVESPEKADNRRKRALEEYHRKYTKITPDGTHSHDISMDDTESMGSDSVFDD